MNFLAKALVFVLLGCVCSEDLEEFSKRGQNLNSQGSSFDSNVHLGQGSADETAQYTKQVKEGIQQIVMVLSMKCRVAGHNEVIELLENEMNRTIRCIVDKVDQKNVKEKYSEAVRIGDLPNFLRKYCRVWPDVHGCINPLVSSIEKCLNTEENRLVNQTIDLLDYSNSYFCDNNAQNIIKFTENQGFQCLTFGNDDLNRCLQQFAISRQQNYQNHYRSIMTNDDNECSDMNNLRKCVVGKLATCQSKVPSEITDDFIQKLAKKVCNGTNYSSVHLGQGGAHEPSEYIKQFTPFIQQLIMTLKTKCQVAGHNEVMESLEVVMRNITSCLQVKVDLKDVAKQYSEAVRIGDLPNFFRKYCKVWSEVHGCISTLFSSISKCLSTEENRAIDKSIDLIDYSNSYSCDNNAQHTIKFVENQGFQCVTSVIDDLSLCLTEAMRSREQRAQNQKSLIITYDDNDCSDIHNFGKCVVRKLAKCQSKVPSEITDDFMQKISTRACNGTSVRASIKQA